MNLDLSVINAFIEDTCVLMVIAYLLARGRMLTLLTAERVTWRRVLTLGAILGLIGLTEVIFPGKRSPYVLHTLIVTFAVLVGGLRVGLAAALTVVVGVALLETTPGVLETALMLTGSAFLAEGTRRLFRQRYSLLRGFTAGLCAQSGVVALHRITFGTGAGLHSAHVAASALAAIPANGFGVLLLQLLLNDARMRADSERHRLEAERAQALVAESQLVALRARVHPHFLFNALTSIAALCSLAPERAESSVLRLSQLMRRALEAHSSAPLPLSEEIEYVRGYLEIEAHRFGSRLQITWDIAPAAETALLPAFALQTLVENGVGHGIAPRMGPGHIHITARVHANRVLIAVRDDGVGMKTKQGEGSDKTLHEELSRLDASGLNEPVLNEPQNRDANKRLHGLQLANAQLVLLYGSRARLRLFSREEQGTLAAFAVPLPAPPALQSRHKETTDADRPDCR